MAAKKRTKSSRKKTKAKKSTTKKSKAKKSTTKKSKSKKKPFGGYAIRFSGRKETLEQIFGKKPVSPSEMTKKIWKFVKAKNLGHS